MYVELMQRLLPQYLYLYNNISAIQDSMKYLNQLQEYTIFQKLFKKSIVRLCLFGYYFVSSLYSYADSVTGYILDGMLFLLICYFMLELIINIISRGSFKSYWTRPDDIYLQLKSRFDFFIKSQELLIQNTY